MFKALIAAGTEDAEIEKRWKTCDSVMFSAGVMVTLQ